MGTPLPYILGHENAGWVHEVGSAVTNVAVGDTVILHPTPTCGLCHACRAGDDMHCENTTFPGLSTDGGMAEYLLTSARACVKLDPKTQPRGRRRAGRRRHHRLPRGPQGAAAAVPGHHRVVIGAGGLGHIGVQCLAALTATRIIVVDRNPDALKLAEQLGAHAHRRRRRQPGRRGQGPDRRQRRARGARLRGRAGRRDGRLEHDRPAAAPTSSSATAARCTSRRWTSSPPSATSSATSSAPTTSWPS